MKKPMLFYAYDIDEYSKERGFHRDYRENVPGKIVETFSDMIRAIYNKDYEFHRVEEYINMQDEEWVVFDPKQIKILKQNIKK